MNYQVTPFWNKINSLDLTHSSSDSRVSATFAAMFFLIRSFVEAGWFLRCLGGSESFWLSSCLFHLIK